MIFVYKIEIVFLGVTDFCLVKNYINKLVTCSEFLQEKIIDHLLMLFIMVYYVNGAGKLLNDVNGAGGNQSFSHVFLSL